MEIAIKRIIEFVEKLVELFPFIVIMTLISFFSYVLIASISSGMRRSESTTKLQYQSEAVRSGHARWSSDAEGFPKFEWLATKSAELSK